MTRTPAPEDLHVSDYVGVLRRRWWLVLAVTLLGTLGGLGYLKVAHKVYTATATVYVTATSGTANQVANGRTTGTVNLDTQAQVVQSATVAQAAARLMHATDSVPQLLSRVSVAVPANSQVLSISCQAATPAGAAACAQSFAQAFLAYTGASTTATLNAQLSTLQSRISALQSNSAKLTVEVASLPGNSAQRAAASEQLNSDHSQLASLNGQVAQLTAQLANPSGGSVISSAVAPSSPSSPRALLVIPSGVLAGLLIGLVVAFAVDRGDRRIRGPRDVARLGVPVLMALPLKKPRPELAVAAPRSRAGLAFAELAHVLASSGSHAVVVTGCRPGRGASLVAANLAVALSRNQPDVTLVCADLEGSVIPELTGLPRSPGLAEALAGPASADRASAGRCLTAAPRLRVIPPGAAGREAADLPQDVVDRLLAGLGETARWVVVEAAAVASGPDVYTLAHAAGAAILVAEVPATRRDQVLDAAESLEKMGVTVLGAVLLPPPKAPASWPAPAGRAWGEGREEVPALAADGTRPAPTAVPGS
jgi:capsular polysaccharide biosynthesis protein/Mrp family chromosome partitioning ATPase